MKTETPRTDAVANTAWAGVNDDYSAYAKMLKHGRQLERELAKAREVAEMLSSECRRAQAEAIMVREELAKLKAPPQGTSPLLSCTCHMGMHGQDDCPWHGRRIKEQRDRLAEALRETIPLFDFGFLTIEEKGKVKSAFKTLAAAENANEK